jgi:hypothetical protein
MGFVGKRFGNVVNEVIARKKSIKTITAKTIRSDSAAILEAVVADVDESEVLAALRRQGFAAHAYRSTLRALANVARERREWRMAGKRG